MIARSILFSLAGILSFSVNAATAFEGFYRIERDRRHVGFAVQRLRKDGDRRILTSYFRFKRPDETEVFESYKTVTSASGQPISSEHHGSRTGLADSWARFANGQGRVDFVAPNSRRPAALQGVNILSSTLFLVADLPKLLTNKTYRYRAFSEDHGDVGTGTLHAAGIVTVGSQKIHRLIVDYHGEATEHFVASDGQPLGSRSYSGDLACYWVNTRDLAIDIFKYPDRDVIALFGDLPQPNINAWSKVAGLNAEKVMRDIPKWRGQRVRSPGMLAKANALPVRSL